MSTAEVFLQGGSQIADSIARNRQLGLQERQVNVAERGMDLEESQVANQYARSMLQKPDRGLITATAVAKQIPYTRPVLQPIINAVDSDQIKTRAEFRNALMAASATPLWAKMRSDLREAAEKANESGDNRKAEELMSFYNSTSQDEFENTLDNMMGKPFSLRRTAGQKGTGGGSAGAMKAYYAPDNTVQYVPSMIQPPSGYVPYSPEHVMTISSGGATVESRSGGSPFLTQKRLPAGEAANLNVMKDSMGNLDRMQDILRQGVQEGQDISGPWEIANKYIDNWNILGKQNRNRAEFRQRAAMALKFMYDVMGRQLAVQELKKGEAMLPDPRVDESVNLDRLVTLTDYMKTLMYTKREALSSAGFYVPPDMQPPSKDSKGARIAAKARAAVILDELRGQGVTDEEELKRRVQEQLKAEMGW